MKKQAVNPYLPAWEYIPDGEPRVFDGRVYVYGSHDEARGKRYCTGDYVCWSAPIDDLTSWSFEGITFRRTDDPGYVDQDIYYFAPDVTKGPDGRYYLYYFSSKLEKIGVGVCENPAGHYRYYGDVHFPSGSRLSVESGYGLPFDPAILSDESGNWLYYGFGMQEPSEKIPEEGYKGGFVARLADDMLTICEEPKNTIPGKMGASGTSFEDHAFLEASSIRICNGLYYLVYSSEHGHELCYAYSKFPDRDFVYGGVIVSNGDVGIDGKTEKNATYYLANNHGGMVQIQKQWYIFYHRHTHGMQYSRQGCAEKIEIQPDGKIRQVEITSCGLNQGPLLAKGEYSAHIACCLYSKDGILHYSSKVHWDDRHPYIAQESDHGVATLTNQYIYNMKDGTVCGFKYFAFDGTEKKIRVRTRSGCDGEMYIYYDEPGKKLLTVISLKKGQKWNWSEAEFASMTGTHAIYMCYKGKGSCDLDSFSIE